MNGQLLTFVKICGLRDAVSINAAVAGGAQQIGFIFFEKSPRNISPEHARDLTKSIERTVASVAVSVNADDEFLDHIVDVMEPDVLQLHGSESPERVGQVKERYGIDIMKVFSIRSAQDFAKVRDYHDVADRFLFDAKAPEGSHLPGGNGVAFEWELFAQWQEENQIDTLLPPMLSGGVNLKNIDVALDGSKARAIDISSGVESAPGIKEPELITAFLQRVYEIENR